MIIKEEFGNDYYGNVVIENYPNLQSIVVKKNSLKNLNSLKICNCEKLKIIKTEGGNWSGVFSNVKEGSLKYLNSLKICNCEKLKTIEIEENVFGNVKNVIIESILSITLL